MYLCEREKVYVGVGVSVNWQVGEWVCECGSVCGGEGVREWVCVRCVGCVCGCVGVR